VHTSEETKKNQFFLQENFTNNENSRNEEIKEITKSSVYIFNVKQKKKK
jgi:hypothetical protein